MKIRNKPVKVLSYAVVAILFLSFLTVVLPALPKAEAHNPQMTLTNSGNYCVSPGAPCSGSVNQFGTISSSNGFNPANIPGDAVIDVIECTSASSSAPVMVTSITDSLSNSWTSVASYSPNGAGINPTKTYASFVWQTNMVSTASTSFTITAHFSPVPATCRFSLGIANYGLTFVQDAVFGATSKYSDQIVNFNLISPSIAGQANQFELVTAWTNTTASAGQPTGTLFNGFGGWLNVPTIGFEPDVWAESWSGFEVSPITLNYNTYWTSSTKFTDTFFIGEEVMIFNPNAQFPPSCTTVACLTVGGSTSPSSQTTYELTANQTYYYTASSGVGGTLISNLTTKVTYSNGSPGKSNDTFDMIVYQSSCSSQGIVIINPSCPLKSVLVVQFQISNGVTSKYIHAPQPVNVTINANATYAIGFVSKFSGLYIPEGLYAEPMDYTTEGSFLTTWNPPSTITIINVSPIQMYVYWGASFISEVKTSTTTSTYISTISSCPTVCYTATTTSISTILSTTVNINVANQTQPQASVSLLNDLTAYFPLWVFPILFSPFGIQGVLIGFVISSILGVLLGVLPIWAAFIISLGLVYLIYKRT